MKALVVIGSLTSEDRYGRISGQRVADALLSYGWSVEVLHASQRREIMETLLQGELDLVVPVGFGPPCEDGHLFALARMAGVPSAGPTPAVGSLTLDKSMLCRVVESIFPAGSGVRAPRGIVLTDSPPLAEFLRMVRGLGDLLVVKPNFSGSSEGLVVCTSAEQAHRAAEQVLQSEVSVLVQQLEHPVTCEISCTTLSTESGTVILPIVELPTGDSYVLDADLKFGDQATSHHVIPARLDQETLRRVEDAVQALMAVIGAVGLTRTDILVLPGGELVILEVNGIPGLLPTSIAVDSAAAAGITFEELALRYAMSAFLPRKEPRVWT